MIPTPNRVYYATTISESEMKTMNRIITTTNENNCTATVVAAVPLPLLFFFFSFELFVSLNFVNEKKSFSVASVDFSSLFGINAYVVVYFCIIFFFSVCSTRVMAFFISSSSSKSA